MCTLKTLTKRKRTRIPALFKKEVKIPLLLLILKPISDLTALVDSSTQTMQLVRNTRVKGQALTGRGQCKQNSNNILIRPVDCVQLWTRMLTKQQYAQLCHSIDALSKDVQEFVRLPIVVACQLTALHSPTILQTTIRIVLFSVS